MNAPRLPSSSLPAGAALLYAARARSRRKRRGRRTLLVGGGILLVALAVLGAGRLLDEATRVASVEISISGPGAISGEEVSDLLGIVPGTPLRRLDLDRLRGRLLALPRVADARIDYAWFRRLTVAVSERAAVATICLPGGGRFEVAADGYLLQPLGQSAADLPLLSWEGDRLAPGVALAAGERLDLHGAPDLLALLRTLQSDQPPLWTGISEAHLLADGTYELYWIDCPTVVWGRGPVSDARLRAWATIMGDLRERGERDAVVDLRFREQIVVRLPEESTEGPAPLG